MCSVYVLAKGIQFVVLGLALGFKTSVAILRTNTPKIKFIWVCIAIFFFLAIMNREFLNIQLTIRVL